LTPETRDFWLETAENRQFRGNHEVNIAANRGNCCIFLTRKKQRAVGTADDPFHIRD